jgi:hypothetical protein
MTTVKHTTRLLSATLIVLVLTFTGCDSLEFDDPNAPRADQVSIQNLATGTEGGLRDELDIYLQTVSIFGREAYYFEPADPRYTGELYTGPLDANGFLVVSPWSGRYRAIGSALELLELANIVRDETPDEISEAEVSAVDGFVQTIIGYQLLIALNSTWDNGLKIEYNDDVNTPVVSRERAFERIDQYLDDGLASLQNGSDLFPFQLSSGFSNDGFDTTAGFAQFNRALRARSAAYQGDYVTTLDVLEESFISENVRELATGVYHAYATGIGERTNPLFEVPTADVVKLRAHPSFTDDARSADERVSVKTLDRTDDAENPDNSFDTSPNAANGLSSPVVTTRYTGATDGIPMVRNAELLLLRAEANILSSTPDLAAAEADLNIIRNAAGLGDYNGPTTQDALFEEMVYNRRYELYLEGHRWVDARRFGILDRLEFPYDTVGDGSRESIVFRQVPIPQNELPES